VNEVDLGLPALAGLSVASVLFTAAALLVFRSCSDQAAVRRTKSLAHAHLLEFNLFKDEPRLILRAQRDLLLDNFRLMRLLLPAFVVLALPGIVLFGILDACYGRAKLPVGQPAVVTAQLAGDSATAALIPTDGIRIETEPVRVAAERQLAWRIRPLRPASGPLRFETPVGVVTKSLSAGTGISLVSTRRESSWLAFLVQPTELPFSHPLFRWIAVQYPKATILGLHWIVWFLLISLPAALLLKRPLRTAF
jgi:hypothetical protein